MEATWYKRVILCVCVCVCVLGGAYMCVYMFTHMFAEIRKQRKQQRPMHQKSLPSDLVLGIKSTPDKCLDINKVKAVQEQP